MLWGFFSNKTAVSFLLSNEYYLISFVFKWLVLCKKSVSQFQNEFWHCGSTLWAHWRSVWLGIKRLWFRCCLANICQV